MNGDTLPQDFKRYRRLVKKGIGGFIVFGGKLQEVRRHINRLQEEAPHTLIMASDLERGLGQQLRGGTHFPPAMALSAAARSARGGGFSREGLRTARAVFTAVAQEAAYAGINTVFAPVLDINTNPRNPIIAARSFGEDAETVSIMGCEMIGAFQKNGIAACGKHFPGHGDTEVDSHIRLPSIKRSLASLRRRELVPFQSAMDAGVAMIMLGHLSVPAMDPSGAAMTVSGKAVSFIRKNMGYDGTLITDAMNMGGIGGYTEDDACLMALRAGVDLILHPIDPDRVASRLREEGVEYDSSRLQRLRRALADRPAPDRPEFALHRSMAADVTQRSVQARGLHRIDTPFLVVFNDDDLPRGGVFIRRLKKLMPSMRRLIVMRGDFFSPESLPQGVTPIVAVFSETRGWKGGAGRWLFTAMGSLDRRDAVFISFGSPYLLAPLKKAARILAYWDGTAAQEAAADIVALECRRSR